MAIKHVKVSTKPDSTDPALIQPSDWNSEHTLGIDDAGILFSYGGDGIVRTVSGVNQHYHYLRHKFSHSEEYEFSPLTIQSKDYNFPPQVNVQPLAANQVCSVTLIPVPLGVNATDIGHYLFIQDTLDSNKNEIVRIEGGDAISGNGFGNILFRPQFDHTSGTYNILSATSGIQEAINVLPNTGGTVYVGAGIWSMFGPVNVLKTLVAIVGETGAYFMGNSPTMGTHSMFQFGDSVQGTGGDFCKLENINIEYAGIANGAAIKIFAQNRFIAKDIFMQRCLSGIDISFSTNVTLMNINVIGNLGDLGMGFLIYRCNGMSMINCTAIAEGNPILVTQGLRIREADFIRITNCDFRSHFYELLIDPAENDEVKNILFQSCTFSYSGSNGIGIYAANVGSKVTNVNFVNCGSAYNNGVGVLLFGDLIRGITFSSCSIHSNTQTGIHINGPNISYCNFTGNKILANGQSAGEWYGIHLENFGASISIISNQISSFGFGPSVYKHKYGIYIGTNHMEGNQLVITANSIDAPRFDDPNYRPILARDNFQQNTLTGFFFYIANNSGAASMMGETQNSPSQWILLTQDGNHRIDFTPTSLPPGPIVGITGGFSGQILEMDVRNNFTLNALSFKGPEVDGAGTPGNLFTNSKTVKIGIWAHLTWQCLASAQTPEFGVTWTLINSWGDVTIE